MGNIAKPTAIRLFVSSTFSDMKEEREYFNNRIIPQLQKLCRDKGISFFAVDLRWGITREDIQNDQLVRLCLEEVDKCRPFFLGIIGDRYGTPMETVPPSLLERYPWLAQKQGASYTELEITYHFLDSKDPDNMLFLFKEGAIPAPADHKLQQLKALVRKNAPDHIRPYRDLEMFGQAIISQFTLWLQTLVGDTDVHLEREKLYQRELLEQTTRNVTEEQSIQRCIQMADSTVLIHGEGPLGKTSLLNAVARTYPEHIIINCAADEANGSWQYVVRSIYEKLNAIADLPAEVCVPLLELLQKPVPNEDELAEHCRAVLESVVCDKPTLLAINDLEYIFGTRTKYLQWLPAKTRKNFRIVCSANHPDIINSARMMEWTLLELRPMNREAAGQLLEAELTRVGKNAKAAAPLLDAPLAGYPGFLKTAIDVLNCFGTHKTITELSALLASSENFSEFYKTILNQISAKYPEETVRDLLLTLGAAALSPMPLDEAGRYAVLQQVNGASKLRWSAVTELISALRLLQTGDVISSALRSFVLDTLTTEETAMLSNALGQYRLSRAEMDQNPLSKESLQQLRCAMAHFCAADNWEILVDILKNPGLLAQLCFFDHDCVRKAYATVLFSGQRNVAKLLGGTMRQIADSPLAQTEYGKIALINLPGIYGDLELEARKETRQVAQLANEFFDETLQEQGGYEERNFAEAMRAVVYEALPKLGLAKTLERMAQWEDQCDNPRRKAVYLNVRAELFLKARQENVMEAVNAGLSQSIRAADMYELLSAYDAKTSALICQKQYSEAQAIANIGLRWAQELGYVFYHFAFANHLVTCLYRNKDYGGAIRAAAPYMEICQRISAPHHEAVFAKAIAMSYNFSERYDACIAFVDKKLSEGKYSTKSAADLAEVMSSAYLNLGRYNHCRKLLKKQLTAADLPASKRMLFTAHLGFATVLLGGKVNAEAARLLNDAFTAAQTNGNFLLIHSTMDAIYRYCLLSEEGKQLIKKWGDAPDRQMYFRKLSVAGSGFDNGFSMVSVKSDRKITVDMSPWKTKYRIAVERQDEAAAVEAAKTLARSYADSDPVEEARWYLRAAEAVTADKRKWALKGLFVLMDQGKPRSEQVLDGLLAQLTPADELAVALWREIGAAVEDYDDQKAEEYLTQLMAQLTDGEFANACIGDLANALSELAFTMSEPFQSWAERCGLEPVLLDAIYQTRLKRSMEAYEKIFDKKTVIEAKKREPAVYDMVNDSGCFKVEAQSMPGLWVLRPKYQHKHLERVVATLIVQEHICRAATDVVFRSVTDTVRERLQTYVDAQKPPLGSRITLLPNDMVRCELQSSGGADSLPTLYKAYARFALQVIRELDALAETF